MKQSKAVGFVVTLALIGGAFVFLRNRAPNGSALGKATLPTPTGPNASAVGGTLSAVDGSLDSPSLFSDTIAPSALGGSVFGVTATQQGELPGAFPSAFLDAPRAVTRNTGATSAFDIGRDAESNTSVAARPISFNDARLRLR